MSTVQVLQQLGLDCPIVRPEKTALSIFNAYYGEILEFSYQLQIVSPPKESFFIWFGSFPFL